MAKQRVLTDPKNTLTTFKAWITGITTGIIVLIPSFISRWLYGVKEMYGLSMLIAIFTIIAYFWIYGWLANKMWGWK